MVNEKLLLSVTMKKSRGKHPAVAFYWDVIHNIRDNVFLDPEHVVNLQNYFVKPSTADKLSTFYLPPGYV